MKEIYLAGGCFWGVEKYLKSLPGIMSTDVGYANGNTEHPSYEEVCSGNTGHTETVRVEYNPEKISISHILHMYFDVIDPTSLNRQGNDVGSQYRTGIYYVDPEDENAIKDAAFKLQQRYEKPIVIEIKPLKNYYLAEEYHQNYLDKNPNGYCHISKDAFKKAGDAIVNPCEYTVPDDNELRNKLTPLQYQVVRENDTEPPYENEYHDNYHPGIYVDIVTGEPLFSSKDKFESCGWPSFTKTIDPSAVKSKLDLTHGMVRDEVRSRVGDSHLGHVFSDGPKETGGLRYCINSAALRFIPKEEMEDLGYGKYLYLV